MFGAGGLGYAQKGRHPERCACRYVPFTPGGLGALSKKYAPVHSAFRKTGEFLVRYQDQERLSHLIAQTTTDAFVAIDPHNRIIYWNRGAERLFGWSAQEILGKSLNLIVPEIHRANHSKAVRRLSVGGQSRLLGQMTNVTALCRDGRSVDVELSLTHWDDPSTGEVAGFAAIMRDAGERLRLEAERDAYQKKLEAQFSAIEATSDGVGITDAEGFFVYLNPAHCTMFGYDDASALIGRHWSVLYKSDEAKRLEDVAMPSVLEMGSWRGEACGLRRDGSAIEQEVALAQSPGGGLVCTTRHIEGIKRATRDRIRAREKLLLAERKEMIGRAVSGMAHDLANFIAVISVSATTLRIKSQPCPSEIERIEGAARQASKLLESALAAKPADRPTNTLDAKSALQTVIELTAFTLKASHSITLEASDDKIVLQAAETDFLRVMMNLCSNARDALPVDGPGSIKVILEKLDPARELSKPLIGSKPQVPSALITVTDTGCGIENEDFARIFEPFHTTKSYGTGLGLAVVSNVVTEAGGSIHIKSGINGTAFQLVWPRATCPFARTDGEDVSPDYMLPGAKILIVDDNPLLLDLIASEVGKTGAEVTAVSSPLQALHELEAGASGWDAIILDYDMPEMNGAQLAAHIRADLPRLPIILCSALYEIEIDVDPSLFDARVIKSAISSSLNQTLVRVLKSTKVEMA